MNKLDRCILLGSVGVFLISIVYMIVTVKYQNIAKENLKLSKHEEVVKETQNVFIWREYHDQQMAVLNAILEQLKEQKLQKTTQCL